MSTILSQHFQSSNGRKVGFRLLRGSTTCLLVVGGYSRVGVANRALGQFLIAHARHHGYSLVILETPGQDEAGDEWARITVPAFATYILELSELLRLEACIGIGASLGGWAMLLAQQQKASILSDALLLAPAVNWDIEYFQQKLKAGALTKHQMPDGSFIIRSPDDNILVPADLLTTAQDARINTGNLTLPGKVHVLQGAEDRVVSVDATKRLTSAMAVCADVRLRILDGVGHELSILAGRASAEALALELDELLRHKRERSKAV